MKTNAILSKISPDLWLEARAFDDTSDKKLGNSRMCPWIALRNVTGTQKRGSHTVPLFTATSCNQQFVTQACCKKGYRIRTPVCGTHGLASAAPVRHAPLPPTMAQLLVCRASLDSPRNPLQCVWHLFAGLGDLRTFKYYKYSRGLSSPTSWTSTFFCLMLQKPQ